MAPPAKKKPPHLVFFPFPAQGHVTPALQLARLLHRYHGFDVTFVHTEHNRRRLLRARSLDTLAGAPGFRFTAVPDGLPASDEDAAQDMAALHRSLLTMVPHFKKLVLSQLPASCCLVSDVDHILRAAEDVGLPCVTFWITRASSFLAFQQCQQLIAKGLVPLRATSSSSWWRAPPPSPRVLPLEFLAETEGRGCVTSWCPQEAVLRHAAVGAFLTHCGWNSMLESVCAGVPMLCWLFEGDQQPNSRLACAEWRVGVELGEDPGREEVEAVIRLVMGGEQGEELRRSAAEWKENAALAAQPGGSSWVNLKRVVHNEVLAPLMAHEH